jgi:hypothetical protein
MEVMEMMETVDMVEVVEDTTTSSIYGLSTAKMEVKK